MATKVEIIPNRINSLSTQIRSSLALANSAMNNGDFEAAIAAEKSFVKAWNELHAIQKSRRLDNGMSR